MVPGPRLQAVGSRPRVPGPGFQAPGSRRQAQGSRVPDFRLSAPGAQFQVTDSNSRRQVPGSRFQAIGNLVGRIISKEFSAALLAISSGKDTGASKVALDQGSETTGAAAGGTNLAATVDEFTSRVVEARQLGMTPGAVVSLKKKPSDGPTAWRILSLSEDDVAMESVNIGQKTAKLKISARELCLEWKISIEKVPKAFFGFPNAFTTTQWRSDIIKGAVL